MPNGSGGGSHSTARRPKRLKNDCRLKEYLRSPSGKHTLGASAQTAKPSSPGIMTSSTIRSTLSLARCSSIPYVLPIPVARIPCMVAFVSANWPGASVKRSHPATLHAYSRWMRLRPDQKQVLYSRSIEGSFCGSLDFFQFFVCSRYVVQTIHSHAAVRPLKVRRAEFFMESTLCFFKCLDR